MSNRSWHLPRRTFLLGAGASLALPYLECMGADGDKTQPTSPPKRLCGIYFPFGVSLPKEDGDQAKWRWFPDKEGKDFQFNESLKSLDPLRAKLYGRPVAGALFFVSPRLEPRWSVSDLE